MRHQIKNGLACFGNGRGIILAEKRGQRRGKLILRRPQT